MNRLKNPSLTVILKLHRDDLVEKWVRKIHMGDRLLLVRLGEDGRKTLGMHVDEIVDVLEGKEKARARKAPYHDPRHEISILLMGEVVMVDLLKSLFDWEDEEWGLVRCSLNRAFHGILRRRSRQTCLLCRAELDRELAAARREEDGIADALKGAIVELVEDQGGRHPGQFFAVPRRGVMP